MLAIYVKPTISFDVCKFMVKVGGTYTVQCNSKLTTADNLVLRRYNDGIIPRREYRIIDNHTIEYQWDNIPRINTKIECNFPDENKVNQGIFIKNVVAETEPKEVTNFKCVSYDFQYIRCDFHKPEQYYTHTEIEPSDNEVAPKLNNFTLSQPKYNPGKQNVYNFTVRSKNCFADITQIFSFNHLDNVIPGKPNVSLTNIKPNGVILRLTMHDILYMEKGLLYEIKIKKTYFGSETKIMTKHLNPKLIQHTLAISKLHAFKSYIVQVRTKSVASDDTLEMWSLPTNVEFTTLSKPPDFQPRIDGGSFHVGPEGSIQIYWELVPETEYNGDNFTYEISIVQNEGFGNEIVKKEISNGFSVKFDVPLVDSEISIRSVNSNGTSPEAILKVPKTLLPPPRRLRSVYDQKVYYLSWEAPYTEQKVESYTVFHCISEDTIQEDNICDKNFNFSRVGANVHSMNLTNGNQFAISANYVNGSSGMIWIDCTAYKGSDIGVVTLLSSKAVNSTAIQLKWTLSCTQKTLLKTLIVNYCLKSGLFCANITLFSNAEEIILSNLLPNSEYLIELALMSEDVSGPFSRTIEETTLEAAPSAPRNLKACEVTKESITLVWNRPERLNGRLRYYKIWYNEKFIELSDEVYLRANEVSYNLTNLKSYEVYDIFVLAATISDSVASNAIHVRTTLKEPPMLLYTHIERLNPQQVKISWKQHMKINSLISIYEIKYENDVLEDTQHILLPSATDFIIENLNCSGSTHNYKFSIRTINIALENQYEKCFVQNSVQEEILSSIEVLKQFNGSIVSFKRIFENSLANITSTYNLTAKVLYAPWSVPLFYECEKSLQSYDITPATFFYILSALLVLTIISTAAYYVRRQYLIAKNINIILPDGVAIANNDPVPVQNKEVQSYSDCEPETLSFLKKRKSSCCSSDEGYHSCQLSPMALDVLLQYEQDKTLPIYPQNLTAIEETEEYYLQRPLWPTSEIWNYHRMTSELMQNEAGDLHCNEINITVSFSSDTQENLQKIAPDRSEMFDANGYVISSAASKLLKTKQDTTTNSIEKISLQKHQQEIVENLS